MFRTANPALNSKTFTGLEHAADSTNVMTIQGTVNRTAFLLFLGGISSIFEAQYPGIVIQAVGLTFGTLFCLLIASETDYPNSQFLNVSFN